MKMLKALMLVVCSLTKYINTLYEFMRWRNQWRATNAIRSVKKYAHTLTMLMILPITIPISAMDNSAAAPTQTTRALSTGSAGDNTSALAVPGAQKLTMRDLSAASDAQEEAIWAAAFAQLLTEAESRPETQQKENIHALVKEGDTQELAKILTAQPAPDVNTPDAQGRTPLHIAVCNEDPATAQLLLDHGADPDCPSPIQTPRQMAYECAEYPGTASALVYKWPQSPTAAQHTPTTPQ